MNKSTIESRQELANELAKSINRFLTFGRSIPKREAFNISYRLYAVNTLRAMNQVMRLVVEKLNPEISYICFTNVNGKLFMGSRSCAGQHIVIVKDNLVYDFIWGMYELTVEEYTILMTAFNKELGVDIKLSNYTPSNRTKHGYNWEQYGLMISRNRSPKVQDLLLKNKYWGNIKYRCKKCDSISAASSDTVTGRCPICNTKLVRYYK